MRTETRGTSVEPPAPTVDLAPAGDQCSQSRGRPDRSVSPQRYWFKVLCFSLVAMTGLVSDLWSKHTVFSWLKFPGQHQVWKGSFVGIPVDFQFATTFNLGALWGMGQGQTWLFASLSIVAVFALVYFLWTGQAVESWSLTIASGLLLAGTLGNLYDRLGLHGYHNQDGPIYGVRDFLDFVFFDGGFHWATFNLADSFLVTGAILLILQSFLQPTSEPVISSATPQSCP